MTFTGNKLILKSPAKINLGLRVVGKREDGYHSIETIFQMISIFDILTLRISNSGITLKTNIRNLPINEKNLVAKAARLLQRKTGVKRGVEIILEKNIPIGAGLGGGSSNAAFTLMALNNMWQLNLSKKDLKILALELGSDVPFFLSGPTAYGKGRGEILTPFKSNKTFFVVVVFPNIFIQTGDVYSELNLGLTSSSKDITILRILLKEGRIADSGTYLCNDLETVVCNKYPDLVGIKKKLVSFGAIGALVSGSGSSVFGLFLQPELAHEAAAKLKKKGWQIFLAKTINKKFNWQ